MDGKGRSTRLLLGLALLAALLGGVGIALVSRGGPATTPTAAGSKPDLSDPATRHPLAGGFRVDDTTVADCDGADHPFDTVVQCREQALGNIAFRSGPDAAFDVIDAKVRGADAAAWQSDAHLIQHIIGSATLARLDGATGRAFAQGDRSNATAGSGGYYHGIILRAMQGTTEAELGTRARELCDDEAVRANPFLTHQCLHGMGHGLMIYTGADLDLALRSCDQMATDSDRFSCLTGAFMENVSEFLGIDSGVRSRHVRADDPLYPCNAVEERFKRPCYIQATLRIGPDVDWSWKRIGDVCRTAEPRYVQLCFYSVGGEAWWRSDSKPGLTLSRCRQLAEGSDACIHAAATWVIANNDASGRQAAALCRAARPDEQPHCFSGLGTAIRQVHPADYREMCARLAGSNAGSCLTPERI